MTHSNKIEIERTFITEFITTRCRLAKQTRLRASDLYAAYQKFCAERRHSCAGPRAFGIVLGELGYEAIKSNVIYWRGLVLIDPPDPPKSGRIDGRVSA